MKRFFLHPLTTLLGGALLVFLGVYLFGRYDAGRAVREPAWKAKYEEQSDTLDVYRKAGKRDSIVYRDRIIPNYIHVRDAANADPATPEGTKKVIRACDAIVSACDSIQKNLRGQIRSLEAQKDLLEHKPGPPRIVGYGDVLYDAIGMRPVFRAGTNVKILGPLHARIEGEYAIPSQLRTGKGDGFRVLVGARINLNR